MKMAIHIIIQGRRDHGLYREVSRLFFFFFEELRGKIQAVPNTCFLFCHTDNPFVVLGLHEVFSGTECLGCN